MITATLHSIVQDGVDALSLGSTYALYALGIALVFSVMRLINFAHGELITAGAMTMFLLAGVPFVALLGIVLVVVVALALLTERVAFRPVRDANPATLLVTSFAVSYLLQSLAVVIFGSTPRTVNIAGGLTGSFTVGGIEIGKLDALTIGLTATLLVGLALFLARTSIGTQMRAAAEDFQMARLVGVRANRVIAVSFALSGLLASIAAFLLLVQTASVTPTMGITPVLIAFIATVIGGMGSLQGAVLGGMLMGVATVVLQITLPIELRPYRDAFVFAVVLAVLVLRPGGLSVARSTVTRI
jgi:branched-chain amino acid transport system permease protein